MIIKKEIRIIDDVIKKKKTFGSQSHKHSEKNCFDSQFCTHKNMSTYET